MIAAPSVQSGRRAHSGGRYPSCQRGAAPRTRAAESARQTPQSAPNGPPRRPFRAQKSRAGLSACTSTPSTCSSSGCHGGCCMYQTIGLGRGSRRGRRIE
eukprot:scaffold978_cov392-Prasinococcus_capsulatus_cf.AAC.31